MKILCTSIDLPGHLDWGGYLATAHALSRRGHDVRWASGEAVGTRVRQSGVTFKTMETSGWRHQMPPLSVDLSPEAREEARRERALAVWLSPEPVLQALVALEALAAEFKPDVVLVEPYMAAGVLLAEKLALPMAVVGRPALPPTELDSFATDRIGILCEGAGVPGAYWDLPRGMPRSACLHLDFFCRSWYADLPVIANQTRFCGGLPAFPTPELPARLKHLVDSDRPVTLVTLGSTFANDEIFFRLAAESVQMVGGNALVVTGKRTPRLLSSLQQAPPGRSTVADWIDYEAVFPYLTAVIHHGGVATTHAALLHGVPQVIVPHAGDQFPQAARITQAQVGYGIRPRDFTLENAPMIVADAVYDPAFRENAVALAKEMQALGGVETAVESVENL